jgi:hypothetical protein
MRQMVEILNRDAPVSAPFLFYEPNCHKEAAHDRTSSSRSAGQPEQSVSLLPSHFFVPAS